MSRAIVPFDIEIEPFTDRADAHISIEASRSELRRRLRHAAYDDETAGGSALTSDQNVGDEWADAIGVHYDDFEELRCGDKERERDAHRWELDPASADDWLERMRA